LIRVNNGRLAIVDGTPNAAHCALPFVVSAADSNFTTPLFDVFVFFSLLFNTNLDWDWGKLN
jgi:hypothetical protein